VSRAAYRRAGVDVAAGQRAVELMRERVAGTWGPEVLTTLGGFAAAVALPPGMRDPVLVSASDGVGTKTAIAARVGRFDTIGVDLVAMCVDDVVCLGARPLFFLDYVAVEHLDATAVAELVGGMADACREVGCALVGGETAEHPGLLPPGAFDLAGCCVGVVERDDLLAEPMGRAGDAIVGLAASGLHANGFSLVRSVLAQRDLDLATPYLEVVRLVLGDEEVERVAREEPDQVDASLGDVLLTPTRLYAPALLAMRAELASRGLAIHGFAHVTGGGLPGNLPRALTTGAQARIHPGRWPVPGVMRLLAAMAGLTGPEMRAVFNGGIGMVVVVEPAAAAEAIRSLADRGLRAWHVGDVVEQRDDRRYVEEGIAPRASWRAPAPRRGRG
jgi:phosphoribosylformylglycinamidine cyclo-ligase